ncbi:hypothetical protein ncot_11000 [Nocardioides sp. JQ2195]|uniref:hypothetical protein n=1 Tax=Nocardioides sp. JQ2195 TaxID=2592334 RepID=UPI00143E603C|nr:hypothetical protein [Nocardioides sp. JQ2195]QIX27064.1 hypothetical protein ncot_11000 [Nocardioides sp. JQ2195]
MGKPDTPAGTRLDKYWDIASKYVVHFGRPRVPENLEDLQAFRIGGQLFHSMATDALEVFGRFLVSLESVASRWQHGSLIPDSARNPVDWRLRIRAEQATILRAAFDEGAEA